jgi:hypothetical protein
MAGSSSKMGSEKWGPKVSIIVRRGKARGNPLRPTLHMHQISKKQNHRDPNKVASNRVEIVREVEAAVAARRRRRHARTRAERGALRPESRTTTSNMAAPCQAPPHRARCGPASDLPEVFVGGTSSAAGRPRQADREREHKPWARNHESASFATTTTGSSLIRSLAVLHPARQRSCSST